MKKPLKIFIGLASLWPVIYFCAFILFFVVTFLSFAVGADEPPEIIFLIIPLHFLTMLWIFGLIVFYIYNIFQNDRIDGEKKALWAVVIFLGNMIAMPVYWYFYIWREPEENNKPRPS